MQFFLGGRVWGGGAILQQINDEFFLNPNKCPRNIIKFQQPAF